MTPTEKFSNVVREYMPRLLKDLPMLTAEDGYAIFGNFGHESGGMTKLQEIKPVVAGSRGGYGWAQWTGPRRRAYEAWCEKNGLSPASDEANYRFFIHELGNGEGAAIGKLKAAKGLLEKVTAFELAYERAGVKHYDSRMAWAMRAKSVWEKVTATPQPDQPPVETEEKKGMFEGMIMTWVLNKAKAIIAFFLTGLVTLVIQSIEQGGGINIPTSTEEWIKSAIAGLVAMIGVYAVPNKPMK